jgi:capsular exopolysaccharide synthesis family protein
MDRPPKLLFITSSTASEGKSTIAVNLALAFASEERVLLVEGDLRKPNLRRLLGKDGNGASLTRGRGLSNYLTGMSEDIVQETGHPNLSAVFAGTIPPNPSELLASNRMREFIAEMYQRFDRIIIDGPPAPGFADALILGHYADGVIFVSVLGQTHREALRVFRKSLDNVGGRMIGVIVNKYSQIGHYGYYKYYRYYHYQSSYYQQGAGAQVLASGDGNGEKTGARADE